MAAVLTLVTFNVHSCVGLDGRYDVERVASVIRSLEPDVVGLQEVDRGYWNEEVSASQPERLASLTGMEMVEGRTLERETGAYGNALLTNLPIVSVERIDLTVPGYESRGALRVGILVGDTTVDVVATHLGLRPVGRARQIRTLLDHVAEPEGRVQIVCGDFNEWAGRSRSQRLLCEVLGPSPRPATYPSWLPVLALDRIWVRPAHLLMDLDVPGTRRARRASDHRPLRASVRIPDGGTA